MNKLLTSKLRRFHSEVEKTLSIVIHSSPSLLDEQFHYALLNGGKRLRPIMTMLCCELSGGKYSSASFPAAAMEMLHTFTLIHDDIMDNSDTRRGFATIHKQWDVGTAILSGDEILSLAYRALLQSTTKNSLRIVETFTQAFYDVCEGQAYDKDFEIRNNVSTKEYFNMIELKTSALFSASAVLVGLAANVSERKLLALENFGKNIGIAFQIQDDYLDNFGNEKTFGKKIGGDIAEGKRTYFLVRALEQFPRDTLFKNVAQRKLPTRNIPIVIRRFEEIGLRNDAEKLVTEYTTKAITALNVFDNNVPKKLLIDFVLQLIGRKQ